MILVGYIFWCIWEVNPTDIRRDVTSNGSGSHYWVQFPTPDFHSISISNLDLFIRFMFVQWQAACVYLPFVPLFLYLPALLGHDETCINLVLCLRCFLTHHSQNFHFSVAMPSLSFILDVIWIIFFLFVAVQHVALLRITFIPPIQLSTLWLVNRSVR